jgi:hypothetical protein
MIHNEGFTFQQNEGTHLKQHPLIGLQAGAARSSTKVCAPVGWLLTDPVTD